MEESAVIRLGAILAIQAEIEGMKIENKINIIEGVDVAYPEWEFQQKAAELKNLAYCAKINFKG